MDPLFKIIQSSYGITKHVDFFRWLQECVSELVPHRVFVAAWGDFSGGQLNYDVVSSMPGVCTRVLLDKRDYVDPLMGDLFHRWLSNGEKWYVINNFDLFHGETSASSSLLGELGEMKSFLVYGARDLRGKNDCLYVFFNHSKKFPVRHSVLGMLMPHVDAALRRIECLEPVISEEEDPVKNPLDNLSGREHDIMRWVRVGKTNQEIGMILCISANTVKHHLARIFHKLDVSSRAQAVAKYMILK
jgi:transcriptional regulator EpsA